MEKNDHTENFLSQSISRRNMLARSAGLVAAGTAAFTGLAQANASPHPAAARSSAGKAVKNGRIKQSIVQWCFQYSEYEWSLEDTCGHAKSLGVDSIELLLPHELETVTKHGLTCAIGQIDTGPDFPFLRGYNNPAFWAELNKLTRTTIDAAAAHGVPNVICFTGFSVVDPSDPTSREMSKEEGAKNCIEGLKQIVGYAEEKNVTLCLEHLNTRDDSHPMKGHPGYQGDSVDYCIDIIKAVGSPRLKLLFDIYHAQIMEGDVIRRIRDHGDYIGHIHTAGNPGRHEIDHTQELNYPAIMHALLEVGYTGYVGQEFLPTRDPYQGLHQAISLCDV